MREAGFRSNNDADAYLREALGKYAIAELERYHPDFDLRRLTIDGEVKARQARAKERGPRRPAPEVIDD